MKDPGLKKKLNVEIVEHVLEWVGAAGRIEGKRGKDRRVMFTGLIWSGGNIAGTVMDRICDDVACMISRRKAGEIAALRREVVAREKASRKLAEKRRREGADR